MEREFNGRKAPWVALAHLSKDELKEFGKVGYKPAKVERRSKFGINKGTLALLIDDAAGNTWVMKGFQPGWRFRTKVLDQDLILVPETGIATIMPDEFFNVYDKTGPGYSNYKP